MIVIGIKFRFNNLKIIYAIDQIPVIKNLLKLVNNTYRHTTTLYYFSSGIEDLLHQH